VNAMCAPASDAMAVRSVCDTASDVTYLRGDLMARPRANALLRRALAEAGCSHSRLARSVVDLGAREYGLPLSYDHSSVICWLDGQQPRSPGPELIAQVISERLGRPVSPAGLGMRASQEVIDLGLDLPLTWPAGIAALTALWKADMDRRQFLTGSSFAVSVYATAGVRLLTLPAMEMPLAGAGGRHIGKGDIASLREIARTYRQLDNRLGDGQLRSAVVQLLDGQVTPLLRAASFNESTGRQLASVAAELSQMVGWMAFDAESHGLAQRYLVQALGFARLAGDNALAAEILAAMSQQAVYVARADQAIDLARAACTMALRTGSPILVTECHVAEAHGHAARNDARSCSQALMAAEHSFAMVRDRQDSPEWLSYFDEAYLSARIAHCFRDLGQGYQAADYARRSLDMNGDFVRGRAFNLALLGTALTQQGDAEQAIEVGLKATEIAMKLQSQRSVRYVVNLHKQLTSVASVRSLQQFTERAETLVRARAEHR
jgi:tetratricopeptide (TPR) repeat protein